MTRGEIEMARDGHSPPAYARLAAGGSSTAGCTVGAGHELAPPHPAPTLTGSSSGVRHA